MEDDMASLFEGMVLFTPSSQDEPPPPPSPPPLPSSSPPLDENLFSDLTLVSPLEPLETTSSTSSSISRHISRRKKKAGIKIGYGRDSSFSDEPHTPSQLESVTQFQLPEESHVQTPQIQSPPPSQLNSVAESQLNSRIESQLPIETPKPESQVLEISSKVAQLAEEADLIAQPSSVTNTIGETVEQKLEQIKVRIEEKLSKIRATAKLVSAKRKESGRKRRKAAESVNLARLKYKELEKELEEACETEDFERAENLSESLVGVEKEKEGFMNELRDAEAECDSVELEMQEVLELQIKAEEEGVLLLQQFAKDSADNANLDLKNAEEFSSIEMNEWQSSVEALEVKKMELEVESHIINDARQGLNDSIEHTIEDERREKDILCKHREVLMEELEKLLALVRQKEAKIAENDSNIKEIEERIAGAVSGFHEVQSNIDTKYYNIQSALSDIDTEGEALSAKKKEIDDFLSQEEMRAARLKELISVTMNKAKACHELVALRKSLALPILKYREVKVRLAKTEEKIREDVQNLRQEVTRARASLQELSSARSSIQQEIASAKQRIFFIDKRSPELEAEKKVAAAARNFKEAGRIAAEAKSLGVEKESIKTKMEDGIRQLHKMEEQITETIKRLNETEELILLKEKEAAMAGCERQRLVAAAAMAERSAALELSDLEEANTLLAEAEAADTEATKFQQAYDLKEEEFESKAKHLISIDLIASLGKDQLAKMAASFSATAV